MRTEQKDNIKNSIGRLVFVFLILALQIWWIAVFFVELNKYSPVLSAVTNLLAVLITLGIYGKRQNAAFKMTWMIFIGLFPIFGILIYIMFGDKQASKRERKRFNSIHEQMMQEIRQDDTVLTEVEEADYGIANQFRYLIEQEGYPLHSNVDVKYFKDASEGLEAQLACLRDAKHYIFMEYHAIEISTSFNRILDILKEKVKEGVEVRILYDDVGSIGFLNPKFCKKMEELGIKCRVFNPVVPVAKIFMNNRDHRKITIIDGVVGFTGGYNLADEYFNVTHPYGYWKDTGIELHGDAVLNLLEIFLEMWNGFSKQTEDYKKYFVRNKEPGNGDTYLLPYADSPLDESFVGENVYLNLIKNAKHYVYITTPYLIISDEMNRELTMAAQRGVDVRIVTPGIPDKKVIYRTTRSYYANLVDGGVRIFEYTPGFIHAKQVIADDEIATIGTINFDFRSLYHHFENGVLMYRGNVIQDMRRDFDTIFSESEEVTTQYKGKRFAMLRGIDLLLRLIAPLL